ncbi:MAG: hypothetical protein M1833_006448 [Piccolia ochrophora]|nr:MAG: hypothetical protein M1833_006448 [Piccolia ochrophora]
MDNLGQAQGAQAGLLQGDSRQSQIRLGRMHRVQKVQAPRGRYTKFPPAVEDVHILGYVIDDNGCDYSRDIGRSSTIGGRVFYQFGDTFCKTSNGEFVGVVSNTIALCRNLNHPLDTEYLEIDEGGLVAPFVPLTPEEIEFEKHKDVHQRRMTIWSFGGIVEDFPGAHSGWCWFEKGFSDRRDGGNYEIAGTGVVRVFVDKDTGKPRAIRTTDIIFGPNEPRLGVLNAIVEDGYIYLYGHHDTGIVLGRVKLKDPLNRDAYEYWNGHRYDSDVATIEPVAHAIQQCSIYRSNLFKSGTGRDYVLLGTSSFATSQLIMGVSARKEGPWEWKEVCSTPGLHYPGTFRYCHFPHPWIFEEEKGELLVTWSEPWPGGVVAAKVTFAMEDDEDAEENTT